MWRQKIFDYLALRQVPVLLLLSYLMIVLSVCWIVQTTLELQRAYADNNDVAVTIAQSSPQAAQLSSKSLLLFGLDADSVNPSQIDASLLGVIAGGHQKNVALIRMNNSSKWYYHGDELQSGVPITQITPDGVIFKYHGKLEKLQLEQSPLLLDQSLPQGNIAP